MPMQVACGGTLVAPYTVLTAAHCIVGFESFGGWSVVQALVGADDSREGVSIPLVAPAIRTRLTGAATHPLYVSTMTNSPHDIAIVRIAQMPQNPSYAIGPWCDEIQKRFIFFCKCVEEAMSKNSMIFSVGRSPNKKDNT